jgi:molybdopterin-binding protein
MRSSRAESIGCIVVDFLSRSSEGGYMKLSARKQLHGKSSKSAREQTAADGRIGIAGVVVVTSSITDEAVDDLRATLGAAVPPRRGDDGAAALARDWQLNRLADRLAASSEGDAPGRLTETMKKGL